MSHDRGSDIYELVGTVTEVKHPERVLVEKMTFRLVGDRVQPLAIHMEEHGRRVSTGDIEFDWALHEVILRNNGREERYPLVTFEDRDEHGQPIGIVAREDVIRALARAIRSSRGATAPPLPYLRPD